MRSPPYSDFSVCDAISPPSVKKSEEEAVEMAGDDEDVEAAIMRKMVSWHLLSEQSVKSVSLPLFVHSIHLSLIPEFSCVVCRACP